MDTKTTSSDSVNLIELSDSQINLSEFDPLTSSSVTPALNEKQQPVVRRPSRPPPPPPNHASNVKTRSSTTSGGAGLTSDLISLQLDKHDTEINAKQTLNKSGVPSLFTLERNRPSFVSYVNDGEAADMHPTIIKSSSSSSAQEMKSQSSSFVSYVPDDSSAKLSRTQSLSTGLSQADHMDFASFEGATGQNAVTSKLLGQREELMQLFMTKRQDDYTSRKPFRLFAGTWNVNGQYPPDSLIEWTAYDKDPPDIYVIGFQELDLSKEAFVFAESSREDEWRKIAEVSLHPKAEYYLVKLVRLVGMMLLVFAMKRHQNHITEVMSHHVGTGLLGKMGNKGGVGVRFNIHSSSICVVNSHLAAHAEEVQRRNQDYADICARMRFSDAYGQSPRTIFQHDVVVWLGDLNYRIEKMLPDMVKECIDVGNYKLLKENDQLLCQLREGNVFKNFEEGEIKFRPTYKYNPGTDVWDTSEKCRAPAWCDRVLWKETAVLSRSTIKNSKKVPKTMTLKEYRSHGALKISDHKPVSASFGMDVKVINKEKYRVVYEEEIRRLDKMENDYLPSMTLSSHTVEFGDVMFQQAVLQSVELHNTGQVPCHFEFIGKFGDNTYCKPWLTISKPKGFVMPDEKLAIEFEVYVNRITASSLNIGSEKLEDILILHLVGGKDFFITLNGKYIASCFGSSLEALCRMKDPIQQVDQKLLLKWSKISVQDANDSESSDEHTLQVPKELWWILDYLYHHARSQPDLFQQPGLHHELQEIQKCLDSQVPVTKGLNSLPGSSHSSAEALLVFLEALPEPVIPFCYYQQCLDVHSNLQHSKELLKTMPVHHRNVFNYLIAFLQELPKYEDKNGLSVHLIATIFAGLILRPQQRKSGIEARIEREKSIVFVERYLMNNLEEL
ncbi:unnamed protein product [Clavelina lepadiformis]|uniref:phosphoinositide 5-phosphatase n=1 Tax=Clavelina lepadiformis TaxID=159417 RepID=A0ABP0EY11_CLALP